METVRKIEYFVLDAADKPGAAARALNALGRINLLAFTGFPNKRRAQIDFIPEDVAVFKVMAKKAKLKVRAKKGGFLIQGDDRPGALADLLGKVAAAKINVTACDAVCAGAGRYGAILWVKPKDVNKAAKVLGVTVPQPMVNVAGMMAP